VKLPLDSLLVDRYRIVALLGRGGMGSVYRARDEQTGVEVALKVVHDPGDDPALLARFEREAAIGAALGKRPGFVRALASGSLPTGDGHYLALELVERAQPLDLQGGSVHDRLRQVGLAAGIVAEAHRQGVVHRDLKPANFLVDPEGIVHLTDFGLAKLSQSDETPAIPDIDVGGVTMAGAALGTPMFMAPEQFGDAGNADLPADVYALGVMLHLALTEQYPYEAKRFRGIVLEQERVRRGDRPGPRPSDHVDVPGDLDALCALALACEQHERPSANELRKGIQAALGSPWPGAAPTRTASAPSGDQAAETAIGEAGQAPPSPPAGDPSSRRSSGSGRLRVHDGSPAGHGLHVRGSKWVADGLRRARSRRRRVTAGVAAGCFLTAASLALDLGGVQAQLPRSLQVELLPLTAAVYGGLSDGALRRVDVRAPSVDLERPEGVDWTSRAEVDLVLHARDASLVSLQVDGRTVPVLGADPILRREQPLKLGPEAGPNEVRIRAVDRAGNAAELIHTVVRVDPDGLVEAEATVEGGDVRVEGRLTFLVARQVRVAASLFPVDGRGRFSAVVPADEVIPVEVRGPRGDVVTTWLTPQAE
jgi:serine/threonine protein kinase